MGLLSKVAEWCLGHANSLIHFISNVSTIYLFGFSLITVVFLFTGKKLTRFTKPGYPKASPLIREIGFWLSIVGVMMAVILSVYYLTIFMFIEFGFSLMDKFQYQNSYGIFINVLSTMWIATKSSSIFVLAGLIVGSCLSIYFNYFLITECERGEGLHDVKQLVKIFKKLNKFNPLDYVDLPNGCFLGLDFNKNPIYVAWVKLRGTHIQVLGASGCGKGVVMSLIGYQSILDGEGVIWIDPKFDRHSPRVLRKAARKAGKDFHMINLNHGQPPQFNLLAEAESHEIGDLLVAGFDLIGKGTDGDYHRGKDEEMAILASRLAVENNAQSIPGLIQQCAGVSEITKQDNFWRKLDKLGSLNVIKTSGGINLVDAIKKGAVIYIVGSTESVEVIMLQKMLLVRIMQITKKLDRSKNKRSTCVVLDEFKYILSRAALTGLGVARDFDVHYLLAHQSIGDLDSCPGISIKEAQGAVIDNTTIKIIFKIGDSDYAEKLSKNSGKRSIYVENAGKSLDNNNSDAGGWRETHVPLIDPDLLTHLPMSNDRENQASTGVLFGVDTASIFYTGPIETSVKMPAPKAAALYQNDTVTDAVDLI